MKQILLDGSAMKDALHLHQALIAALGGPNGHGHSIDAFIDSMIYGGMNEVEPPYEVVVVRTESRRKVRETVEELAGALRQAREWRKANYGDDVEVSIRLG